MKFLVLAMCVCAASAATFSPYGPYNPVVPAAQAAAQVFTAPVAAAEAVVEPIARIVQVDPVPASRNYVPVTRDADAAVIRDDYELTPTGFKYVYQSNNGIAAKSTGVLKEVGGNAVLVSQGAYKYVDPNGQTVEIVYTADENGYQPQGSAIPVAPPLPEAIARSLAYIAAHPAKPETFKQY